MNECFVWKWKGLTLKRPREDRSEENRNDLVTRIKTLEFPPDHLSTVHGCNDVSVRSESGCSGPRPRQPRYLAAAVSPLLCPIGKSPVARLGPRQQHRIPTVPLHSPPLLWLQRFHTMWWKYRHFAELSSLMGRCVWLDENCMDKWSRKIQYWHQRINM